MLKHSIMLWGRAPKAKYLALGRRRDLSNGKKKEDATALLSVLESSYSNPDQSKGRNATTTKDNNPKGKVQNKANRAKSFFDEVDSFLEEQRREKGGGSEFSNFASSSNLFGKKTYEKSANGSSQSKPAAESSRSRKWTSYLPKEDEDSLNEKSIFDVFKVPEPVPERNPNAFDLDAYNAFCSLLNEYFDAESKKSSKLADELSHEMKQDVRRWIQKEEHQNLINLPTLNQLFQDELIKNGTLINLLQAKSDAKKEIRKQSTNFRKHLAWSNNQYKYAVKVLRELSKLSAQQNKAHPVVVIWEKLKEAGYLTNTTIGHCLQACNSFSAISLSRNRRTFASSALNNRLSGLLQHDSKGNVGDAEEETIATVPEQLAITNDLLYEPTNQTISIQLRRSVSLGDAKGAFGFAEAIQDDADKARSYISIFRLFIELGDIDSAYLLFQKMKKYHHVVSIEPELFVQLIAGIAEKGLFSTKCEPIDGKTDLVYPTSGPGLFDEIVKDMSDYVTSISSASAKRLQRALLIGINEMKEGKSPLDQFDTGALAPLRPVNELAGEKDIVADRVNIDPLMGQCPRSGIKLRLIGLEQEEKETMKNSLLKLVQPTSTRKDGKRNNEKAARAKQAMLFFWDWLDTREGDPFTVIVDGANVAFYMQNFDRGTFNFHQIQFVVAALRSIGENPLVILPHKYQASFFHVKLGTNITKQTVRPKDRAVLEGLQADGCLYIVPQGCLDDYFWILATVSDQGRPRKGKSLSVSQEKGGQRWPGGRPVVLTNDQIRDHQLHLLEPRVFNRWYSNTMVNYNFTGFVDDECIDPEIGFSPADFFSREIQMNKSGGSSSVWHFPVHDWGPTEWFCIRIPSDGSESG